MTNFKIRINPITNEVDYTIEGSYEELIKIELSEIKKLNNVVQKIKKTFPKEKMQDSSRKAEKISIDDSSDLKINVPSNLVEIIEQMDDEKIKFALLWSYSTKPVMTINEFLKVCSSTGFTLSPSWHTSTGGYFASQLVSGDKMFRQKGKRGKEKLWELNDVAKLKINAEIRKLERSKQ